MTSDGVTEETKTLFRVSLGRVQEMESKKDTDKGTEKGTRTNRGRTVTPESYLKWRNYLEGPVESNFIQDNVRECS